MFAYIALLMFLFTVYVLKGRYVVYMRDTLSLEKSQQYGKVGFVLLTAFFVVLIAGRNSLVGNDTSGYMYAFATKDHLTKVMEGFQATEWGYAFLQHVIRSSGGSFRCILVFEALIFVIPVAYMVFKYSRNPYTSLFLFFAFDYYLFGMTAIRQSIALGLCMLALEQAKRKKLIKFLLLVCVASTFHQTAMVFLPAYFLTKLSLNKKYLLLTMLVGLAVYVFKDQIRVFIRQFARIDYNEMPTGGTGMYVFLFTTVVLDAFYSNQGALTWESNDMFSNLMIVAVIMFPVLQYNPSIFRLHYYYSIAMIINIPNTIKKIPDPWLRFGIAVMYFVISCYYMTSYPLRTMGAVPYIFGGV